MSTVTIAKVCTVDGCDRRHHGRGLCQRHYQRLHKRGQIGGPRPNAIDTDEVLWVLEGGRSIPSICEEMGHPDSIARALVRDGHKKVARLFTNEARLRKAAA